MAKPSSKSPEMEESLTNLFGFDRREAINKDKCIPPPYGCGEIAAEFKDEISRKEYSISGLCQKCQDETFKEV
jgi:hypothetical protein